jgi:myo-inositol-1(or 4)-monophosphatase
MRELCTKLSQIVKKTGEMLLSATDVENLGGVSEKGTAANLVTKYDVAVQEQLISEIKKIIPQAVFISEEKENDSSLVKAPYLFIIDPIDGTANFVHDYRHSCISVAMFSKGDIKFAAVYDPYQNEMFSAVKGGGAFLNGKPMKVSDRDMPHSIVAFGTCPYYKDTLGAKTFELCYELYRACSDLRRPGAAALDLAYLAAGRNDIFFEIVLSPWDIAAGNLLIKEAGGIITNAEGKDIDFSAPSCVLASNPTVYDEFYKIAKKVIDK